MAQTTFSGPIRSLGGIYQQGPASIVEITSSTTLSPTSHGGRIISVGGTLAANVVLTLPAINTTANPVSSGPGQDPNTVNNEGVTYTIWVPTTIATSSLKIGVTAASGDLFLGTIFGVDTDTSNALVAYTANGSSNDFINFNGSTTGGVAGTWVQIFAIAANKYMVKGIALGSGSVATPFADS
jgi:hypothetical protein